jgi:hypothetical protein
MRIARLLPLPIVILCSIVTMSGGYATTAQLSPDEIFSRARDVISEQTCPKRIEYDCRLGYG